MGRAWLAVVPLLLLLGPPDLLAPRHEVPAAEPVGPEAPLCPDGWQEAQPALGGEGHAVAVDGAAVGPPAPEAKVWSDLAGLLPYLTAGRTVDVLVTFQMPAGLLNSPVWFVRSDVPADTVPAQSAQGDSIIVLGDAWSQNPVQHNGRVMEGFLSNLTSRLLQVEGVACVGDANPWASMPTLAVRVSRDGVGRIARLPEVDGIALNGPRGVLIGGPWSPFEPWQRSGVQFTPLPFRAAS